MSTLPTTRRLVFAAVSGAAAPALLLLGAGTAHALEDVSARGAIAIIADLPTPRDCGTCAGFNPQPDPPSHSGIGNPNDRVSLGGPDTGPASVQNMGPGVKQNATAPGAATESRK